MSRPLFAKQTHSPGEWVCFTKTTAYSDTVIETVRESLTSRH